MEEVRKNIPKLFVNLVLLGNISEVLRFKAASYGWNKIHADYNFVCLGVQVVIEVRALQRSSLYSSH